MYYVGIDISLKELAANTFGESNPIFETHLTSILTLYKTADAEVTRIGTRIFSIRNNGVSRKNGNAWFITTSLCSYELCCTTD